MLATYTCLGADPSFIHGDFSDRPVLPSFSMVRSPLMAIFIVLIYDGFADRKTPDLRIGSHAPLVPIGVHERFICVAVRIMKITCFMKWLFYLILFKLFILALMPLWFAAGLTLSLQFFHLSRAECK